MLYRPQVVSHSPAYVPPYTCQVEHRYAYNEQEYAHVSARSAQERGVGLGAGGNVSVGLGVGCSVGRGVGAQSFRTAPLQPEHVQHEANMNVVSAPVVFQQSSWLNEVAL